MKITIPKTTHPLDLAEYDASFAGQSIDVWVNPPTEEVEKAWKALVRSTTILEAMKGETDKDKADEYSKTMDEIGEEEKKFFALVTGWSDEDVKEFIETSLKTDPALWTWLFLAVYKMARDYQANRKKV